MDVELSEVQDHASMIERELLDVYDREKARNEKHKRGQAHPHSMINKSESENPRNATDDRNVRFDSSAGFPEILRNYREQRRSTTNPFQTPMPPSNTAQTTRDDPASNQARSPLSSTSAQRNEQPRSPFTAAGIPTHPDPNRKDPLNPNNPEDAGSSSSSRTPPNPTPWRPPPPDE